MWFAINKKKCLLNDWQCGSASGSEVEVQKFRSAVLHGRKVSSLYGISVLNAVRIV